MEWMKGEAIYNIANGGKIDHEAHLHALANRNEFLPS